MGTRDRENNNRAYAFDSLIGYTGRVFGFEPLNGYTGRVYGFIPKTIPEPGPGKKFKTIPIPGPGPVYPARTRPIYVGFRVSPSGMGIFAIPTCLFQLSRKQTNFK